MPHVLATVAVVAAVAFAVARLTRNRRAVATQPPTDCEHRTAAGRAATSPARTLTLLTDRLDRLDARRLAPDRARLDDARDRARRTLDAVLKVKLLYEYERLDCAVATAYLEEPDGRSDPPEIHFAVPVAADVALVAELASLPIDLRRDPPAPHRRRRRRRRKVFRGGRASPSLPAVDRWLRRAVLETTAWLNAACDAAERCARPADYAPLAGRAVRLARRFVRVDARFDALADRTTVTVEFAAPAADTGHPAADADTGHPAADPDTGRPAADPDTGRPAADADAPADVVAADGQHALIRDRRRQTIWGGWGRAFVMCSL